MSSHNVREFALGPDRGEDLRFLRPYFLVNLPAAYETPRRLCHFGSKASREDHARLAQTKAKDRIVAWVKSNPVTDVFVVSHGWHRNLFSGVSAYDRLLSRLSLLVGSQRLPDQVQDAAGGSTGSGDWTPFRPLFIGVHWHSDPGEDGWLDKEGRRHKRSFMENVGHHFRCPSGKDAEFVKYFERVFEVLASMSAPGKDAISDDRVQRRAPRLTQLLNRYELKLAPGASLAEKVSVLWTCYFEAEAAGVLSDQKQKPEAFLNPLQSLLGLLQFVIGVVGLGALGSLLPRLKFLGEAILGIHRFPSVAHWFVYAVFWLVVATVFLQVGACLRQGGSFPWQETPSGSKANARGRSFLNWAMLPAYLYAQLFLAAPVLSLCLLSYLLGWLANPLYKRYELPRGQDWLGERAGLRNNPGGWNRGINSSMRSALAWLARQPLALMQIAITEDSTIGGCLNTIDSQLAFFEMQAKGVVSGDQAGDFLAQLYGAAPELRAARLHFLGHSFGGLVVSNAVRRLALHHGFTSPDHRVHTVCLLEAAMASNWFDGETQVLDGVRLLSAIYSVRDTANGFYYPLANLARYAAGYVGLCPPNGIIPQVRGGYASLVRPPHLGVVLNPTGATVLNLDASRLIYKGAVGLGGGHDDIFKDDVVHLLWAVTQLPD